MAATPLTAPMATAFWSRVIAIPSFSALAAGLSLQRRDLLLSFRAEVRGQFRERDLEILAARLRDVRQVGREREARPGELGMPIFVGLYRVGAFGIVGLPASQDHRAELRPQADQRL